MRVRAVSGETMAPLLRQADATHVRTGRRVLLHFAGSNYLGMGRHPAVLAAMREAADEGYVQTAASRATTGEHPDYLAAERELARHLGQPAAALVPCGYLAPMAAVHALRPHATHILLGDATHVCMRDAAAASGLGVRTFPHADPAALGRELKSLGRGARPLVMTDGVFGTRGGMAPLADYAAALPAEGWMLVDDAHGSGAVGPGGRGAVARHGLDSPRILQAISLAKAFGVGGGAVLGDAGIVRELRRNAPAFVGTTAMPLVVVAGIRAALRVLASETGRVDRLRTNMARLHRRLPGHDAVANSPDTPVTRVLVPSAAAARALRKALIDAGIYPSIIRYPGGAESGFLRLALSSEHSRADVDLLAGALGIALESRAFRP